jgi:hypothetical protein
VSTYIKSDTLYRNVKVVRISYLQTNIITYEWEILDEVSREYRRFNARGTQLKVRLLPPPDDECNIDPITHFETCVNALFDYALKNIEDADMVGLSIVNENTEENKKISL